MVPTSTALEVFVGVVSVTGGSPLDRAHVQVHNRHGVLTRETAALTEFVREAIGSMASRQSGSPSAGHPAPACEWWQSTRRSIAFSAVLTLCVAMRGQLLPAQQARQDFLAASIDTTVSPGEDFFQYANGAWLKRNPIPQDEAIWAMWSVLGEDLTSRVRRASEAAAAPSLN